jgi:phosphoglucomutase
VTRSPLAGQPASTIAPINIPRLITHYYCDRPDISVPEQRVAFGTSGHRGSAIKASFNEAHIAAITQAICEYRLAQQIDGPLFLGIDTHALSEPAFATALEVLAANGATVMIDSALGYTPTPAISHAILSYNRGREHGLADGIVITPSHNPPEDGGFKYNPPHGGPADTQATKWIENRANELLAAKLHGVNRVTYAQARAATTTHLHDYVSAYVQDLAQVIDLDSIRHSGLRIGVDPLGGAGIGYWGQIIERYGLNITVVNTSVDPTFRFMSLDWDGKIRMDCSSPYAMAGLIAMKDRYDIAFANDTDYDRHGIVTPSSGLLNPNHYLATAVDYLFRSRTTWPRRCAVGKTVVSSSLIDRVATRIDRPLLEVPVGFKWFVDGLRTGTLGFGGEESAGASFLRHDGTVWTTDKDGIILGLLAAEMTAVNSRDPGLLYQDITTVCGTPYYERIDAPASSAQKRRLQDLQPTEIPPGNIAGDPITAVLTNAPGNGAAIGGLKVVTTNGWFAVRPSGTEDVYKLYAESFVSPTHLAQIQTEAQALVNGIFAEP